MLTGITYPCTATNSFTYNGLDTRVGKVDSSGTSTCKRDGASVTDPVLSDGTIAYTPGFSERKSSTTTFDHADFHGTFTRQTNSSQSTTATRVYDAFGNLESTTGTPQSPFGFVGSQSYQEDGDSGLKLLGHRYYDPSTGRFLTRDPSEDGRNWYDYCDNNPTEDGRNWYDYCDNNPLVATDDSGLSTGLLGEICQGIIDAINSVVPVVEESAPAIGPAGWILAAALGAAELYTNPTVVYLKVQPMGMNPGDPTTVSPTNGKGKRRRKKVVSTEEPPAEKAPPPN